VTACAASSPRTTWTARGSSTATAERSDRSAPIAERSLIESIEAALAATSGPSEGKVIRGPGDDAAVVRARPISVVSLDTMVEGIHFRLDPGWATPNEVGHRALASALSDLAAMGAEPGEAYIALGLPRGMDEQDALALVRGAAALAQVTGTTIAGGDVVTAPALTVSVTVVGWTECEQRLVGRDGGQAGDLVGVTGALGAPGAALALLRNPSTSVSDGAAAAVLSRARAPYPRIAQGRALAAAGASALIDLSDGLAADAAHIGRASGVQLQIGLAQLPLAAGVEEVCAALGLDPRELAATGGEDYELCFCAPSRCRAQIESALADAGEIGVSWIGEVCAGAGGASLFTERGDQVPLAGFEHRWQ
jgi:thiamine-monophosphate kinase